MRRLVAILALDIVGFSALMARSESVLLQALRQAREAVILPGVARHRGRLFKEMGDGFLVELSSAVEAVECAAEIIGALAQLPLQGMVAPLKARIGVTLGDAVEEGGDLFGDCVNIAVRLQSVAEPGGILTSRAVMEQARGKARVSFRPRGERHLKHIPAPVEVWEVIADGETAQLPGAEPGQGLEILLRRPAIAVLPFDSMGGADDHLVDGLTEDLITSLSYWRWFPVIARISTFAFRNSGKAVTAVARELGARYALEGSVRASGRQVRLTAQLIDAESGHHVWAQRYDRALDDIFALQDEVAQQIVAAIEPEISRAEQARAMRRRPEDLDAWDLCLRGLWHIHRGARRDYESAVSLLEQAAEQAPQSGFAWSHLAFCRFYMALFSWTKDPARVLASTFEAAERAVDLDPADWLGRALLGISQLWVRHDFDAAIAAEERAIALNPSASLAHHFFGCILHFAGRPEDGLRHEQAVFRLDPNFPFSATVYADMGLGLMMLSDFDGAKERLEQALRIQPNYLRALQRLVCLHVLRGETSLAASAAAELKRLQPDLDHAYVAMTYPFRYKMHETLFRRSLEQAGALPRDRPRRGR